MKKILLLHVFIIAAIPFKVLAGSKDSALKTKVSQWMSNARGIKFLENKGQIMDMQRKPVPNVLYKASGGGMSQRGPFGDVYVTTSGLSYVFTKMEKRKRVNTSALANKMGPHGDEGDSVTVQYCRADMELVGADIRKENIVKEGESENRTDYYYGGVCPDGILGVHSYGKVTIKNIYPGIDWILHSGKRGLKYDFIVHPGADPSLIKLKYKWTDKPQLQTDGSVKISTPMGNITEGKPVGYSGDRQVQTTYSIENNEIHFKVDNYNTTETLTIDPLLVWSTYYAGDEDDVFSMQDDGKNVWITGMQNGLLTFPTLNPGGGAYFQGRWAGILQAFILQFSVAGVLKWATFYGGSIEEYGNSIYSDGTNVWVTGYTGSKDFPTFNPGGGAYFQGGLAGGYNVFILQFNTSGVRKWATYYGGSINDYGYSINSDGTNVWVTGSTESPDFPTLNPGGGAYFQTPLGGGIKAFILQFNATGVLKWATCYGGSFQDYGYSINSDGTNVWVTGSTNSPGFPTFNPGGGAYFQPTIGGSRNAFVLQFNTSGVRKWATFYGGSNNDVGNSINSDGNNVWVTGQTTSLDFPTYNPGGGAYFQGTYGGIYSVFILKFNKSGVRRWATFYDGVDLFNSTPWKDQGYSIQSDGSNVWVCGATSSKNFPTFNPGCGFYKDTLDSPPKNVMPDSQEVYILQFDTSGIRKWATFYGIDGENDGSYAWSDGTNLFVAGDAGVSFWAEYPTVNPGGGAYYLDTLEGASDVAFISKFIISSLTVSPPVSICRGDSTTITAGGAANYSWSPPGGLSATNIANPVASPTITTTYTVIATGGCVGKVIDSVKITVDTFSGLIVSKDSSICYGQSIALRAGGGTNYKWSTGDTTSSISIVKVIATRTYTLSISNGACKIDTDITITVVPLPTPHLLGNTKICGGRKDTITISGGNKYLWSNGNTTTAYYTGNLNADTTVTVIAYNSLGCSHDTTFTIQVVPIPVPVIKGKLTRCKGETDTLTVNGGTTYLWNNGNTTTAYYTGKLSADTTVTVIAYNSLGCSHDTTFTIQVFPNPAPIINHTQLKCAGERDTLVVTGGSRYLWSNGYTSSSYTTIINSDTTLTVTAYYSSGCSHDTSITITPNIPILSACCNTIITAGNDTTLVAKGNTTKPYQWSPQVTCLNPPICDSVKVSPSITTTYTVTLTDSAGCQVERVITIVVETPCFNFTIPNVFTPNNPGSLGLNGVFYIKTTDINSWSIIIYDRWGKEMFSTTNPNRYWDGNTESGSKAPDGVYYYMINATCQGTSYKKDGFLQLIR